jgi:predicted Zn-dependent protease
VRRFFNIFFFGNYSPTHDVPPRAVTLLISLFLTCFSAFAYSPYSNQELDELEKEFIEEINSSQLVIKNPLAIQFINQLGKTLAVHAQIKTPYFFIVKSNEINAFAGPGGYIGLNSQLILASANESELAAVMAHELAHVRQHHLYRMIEHQKQMRIPMLASMLASIALGVINPEMATGAVMASMSGFAQESISYVRSNEKEADRIGIDMLIKSGLDPRGMASFFKKMQENSRYYYTANVPAILRSHPLDEERIAEAENRSARLAKISVTDPLSYFLFKELIRVASASDNNKQLLDYYQHQCSGPQPGQPCQYGYALALMNANQYKQAQTRLSLLVQQDPTNLNFQIAMAQSEIGLKQTALAVLRLKELYANYPENYAAAMALGNSLIEDAHPKEAAALLLKTSRQFKRDLSLCEELARAQSASKLKAYAYFTEAQCQLLQGRKQLAMRQLKLAKQMASQDHFLHARIDAKMDEVKDLMSTD